MVTIKEIYNELVEAASPSAVAYFPGSFKPPHKGHFNAVKSLASRPFVTQVVVIIGQKEKNGINANMSKDIWNIYLKAQPNPKVKVRIASDASPVKDIFDILDKDLNKIAYVAATMSDPDDQGYVESLTKAFGNRVKPLNVEEQTLVNGQVLTSDQILELVGQLKQYDAQLKSTDKGTTIYSKARNGYLNTLNKLKACFPESVIQKGLFDDVVRILGVDLFSPDELQENVFSIGWWSDVLKEEEYKLDVKPTVKAKDVDPKELKKGIAVEKEHTTDLKTAKRIALNHLGEDPKYYTKLAKAKLEEEQNGNLDSIDDFIKFAIDTLELQQVPKITFTDDEELAKNMHSLGSYNPQTDELLVVRGNRMIADVLRTLAHELVHRKQNELGQLEPGSGATGSPVENEANAAAGVLLRLYGAKNTDIYEAIKLNEVGEISNPFDWKYDFADDDGNYFYSFSSPQNKYSVGISWSGDDSYEVLFNTEGEMGQDTGEGVAMRVLSTVTAITLDFIDRIDPEEVILRPIQTKKAGDKVDTRRFNVYGAYLRKNLPSGYKLLTLGDTYRMIKNK
jgi:nicotinamide mononucleotide adenylyltransferase